MDAMGLRDGWLLRRIVSRDRLAERAKAL